MDRQTREAVSRQVTAKDTVLCTRGESMSTKWSFRGGNLDTEHARGICRVAPTPYLH